MRFLTSALVVAVAVLLSVLTACGSPVAPKAPTSTSGQPVPTQKMAEKPLASPTRAATAPAAKGEQIVHLGGTGLISDAPFYIGMEKGYFKEAGIDIDLVSFASAGDVMASLSAGQLDVVGGGINIGTFNAVARNLPVLVVADRAYLTHGFDGDIWMVRSDLADQIKSIRDLKGRKVAINAASSPLVYMIGKALDKNGMRLQDINIVVLPFPDMVAAFKNKAIDVAIEVEPFVAHIEEAGFAKAWFEVSKETGPMETGVVFFNADWAKKNHELANQFMVAFLKGARDYYDAMRHGPNRAEVVRILTKYTTMKDPALYDKVRWIGLNPDGFVDVASLKDQVAWYVKHGDMKEPVAIDKVVDNTYLEYALNKLGKYKK